MAKSPPLTMRAWQYSSTSGGLEKNLRINPAAALPVPNHDQHLVKVLAAALNPVDYKLSEIPIVGRFLIPKPATPCVDFAGIIVTPAKGSSLKPGQLVFGIPGSSPLAGGALREYNVSNISTTASLPSGLSPADGAAIPVAGLTAYQSIVPRVKKGDKIFINGGSGGTGIFAIQIAKAVGCHVTTTCSTGNVELCKSLGADAVIDYKKGSVFEALKASGSIFDHAVDNVGSDRELIWGAHELLKPGAAYVMVGHAPSLNNFAESLKRKVWPGFLGGFQGNMEGFWPKPSVEHLEQIAAMVQDGKVKCVIDQKFAFEDAPKAFERLKTGRARGKIVVDIASKM